MCGIAGYFNSKFNYKEAIDYNASILTSMITSMKHRGPDEQGFIINQHCCLAHTRLSIIDLFSGRQPMKIRKNNCNYYIVFNGEIYNHIPLRNKLKSLGYTFSTSSDTEVILNCYLYYGPDFVSLLDGIFSIGIFDETLNSLLLFRDNYGVKPLFYTYYNSTIIFASKIDTLFEYPGVKPELDKNGLNEIFTIGPAKTYGTGVFKNIKEVKPGHYLKITPNYKKEVCYYKLMSKPHEDNYAETLDKVEHLVNKAVIDQMLSDVPIATFLSGGIDSSIVTSICAKKLAADYKQIDTYSFDFKGNKEYYKSNDFQPSQDRPYVDIMVGHLHSNHTYLECDTEILADLLTESVDSRCLPTMADVDASLLFFCKLVSKKHKVVLTGECADEIFGGYPWFHKEELLNSNSFPWMPDISFRKSLLNQEFAEFLNMEGYVNQAYYNTLSEINTLPDENYFDTSRRKIRYLNIRWFMQTLLDRMDRTSMQSGLEARVPFANRELVDYVFNIPWDMCAKDGIVKNILRQSARDLVPDTILYRKKSPYPKTYNPDYEKIITEKLKELIANPSEPVNRYIDHKRLLLFLESPKDYGKPWYGQLMAGPQMIAYLIQINYWLKKYKL